MPLDSNEPFASTASYYARYRPRYPKELYASVAERFGLDGTQHALDLGCGPGTIALPLAALVDEVTAVDPEAGMLEQGRALAARQGVANIRWTLGDSATLHTLDLPPLDLCLMGKSFHWMSRDQVLADLDQLTTRQGGVVVISAGPPGTTPLPGWAHVVADVRASYLGPVRRAGDGVYPEPQETYLDTLARSPFPRVTVHRWDQHVIRTLDELIGLQYSNSYSTPTQLGDRKDAFDDDLRKALTEHEPSARFEETIRTEALVATRL
ncbi:class I SAM-dependent methyltransferase [Embleya sp. NPDC005575]|uniref:class I SAM-dependent methyltransferase n=1 Tax=Embleya sp. NPDC005575 TaxID=3156892 RepID=UPI0033B278A1